MTAHKVWQSPADAAKWKRLLMSLPVADYQKLFPDSYNWVEKLGCGKPTMKQVCEETGFIGTHCNPQDFSMWACLFADPIFTTVTVEELNRLKGCMSDELEKYRKQNKMWPHPAILLQKCRARLKLSGPGSASREAKRNTPDAGADPPPEGEAASRYRGVTYEAYGRHSKNWKAVAWVKLRGAKAKVQKNLGRFSKHLEAAKMVANVQKISLKAIKKDKAAVYKNKSAIQLAQLRFKILTQIFVKRPRQALPAWPADYEATKRVAESEAHKQMFVAEPATEEVSIGLKYGPCKDDLLEAWRETADYDVQYWRRLAKTLGCFQDEGGAWISGANVTTFRKLRLMRTLQLVARKLHRRDLRLWVTNCGRYVTQKLGPVMWLRNFGIIEKK